MDWEMQANGVLFNVWRIPGGPGGADDFYIALNRAYDLALLKKLYCCPSGQAPQLCCVGPISPCPLTCPREIGARESEREILS